VTVVFPVPSAETTSMLFVMNGLLPVRVPVQPPGAAALREDPVLHAAITPGELRMTDTSGTLASPCEFEPPTCFDVLANAHAEQLRYHLDAVPPGATLTMWALFVAPPASSPTVTIGIGGYAAKFPAPVTAG
jgi:hypothetical protein